ncbi:metal-dependent hydrolase [Psychromonas ossibalaenae]|uniref:metal-dependent hydrolase n=1 Tax=Psychromonas ossibalaenae TaxID=444922 RepID=UPI0003775FAF|nr:metal-dependent hydrolase [Psychromonas ossibalaenae]
MANFKTHLNTAAVTTGLASSALLSAGHIDLNNALWLWFIGTVGGLLPDIDSDNSTSLDSIFTLFALTVILLVLRFITDSQFREISFTELIIIPVILYSIMKYVIRPIFEKITDHRGSCHSLLFLLLCALLTTQVTWRLSQTHSQQSEIIAWLSGGLIFLGGIIHLILDEVFSVDLRNVRIKNSFGSAFKLADFDNKMLTLLTFIAICILLYISPASESTISSLTDWSKFIF